MGLATISVTCYSEILLLRSNSKNEHSYTHFAGYSYRMPSQDSLPY